MTYCYPAYDLLLPRLRPTAAPPTTYCCPAYGHPGKSAIEAQCVRSAGGAFGAHRKMLVLNLLMFAWDIAKYVGNSKEADGSKAEGAKQKAS